MVYALRVERALLASAGMWPHTVAPGDQLELDEFKSRSALDEWLHQAAPADQAAEEALLKMLRGG